EGDTGGYESRAATRLHRAPGQQRHFEAPLHPVGHQGGHRFGSGDEPVRCRAGGLRLGRRVEENRRRHRRHPESRRHRPLLRDRLPVMAVFNDAWSDKRLYPDDQAQRSVFQFLIPTRMAMDTLAQYAARDRGYKTAALVNDVVIDPRTENQGFFNTSLSKVGMKSVGYESYQLGSSDFGPALQRLKAAHPDMISIFGLSGDTANFVIQIDQLGSAYIDTPTAKDASKGWHPHIFGSPGGTGDHSWAD